MAEFQLSVTDPVTTLPDITVASGVLSIVDHSNYDEGSFEAGHERSDFSDFYKLLITLPSGDEVLYSSIGDGDESIVAPSGGDPEVDYTYPSGDGQYWVTIYTVPTYKPAAAYLYSTLPMVYYNTKIWALLKDGTGQTPAEGEYWTEVADIENLSAKYRLAQRVVIYSDAKRSYARKIYNANVLNNKIGANWEQLLKDPDVIAAIEFFIGINAIPVCMAASRFDEVDTTINHMKQLTSEGEVL